MKHIARLILFAGLLYGSAIKKVKWMKNILIFFNGFSTLLSLLFTILIIIEKNIDHRIEIEEPFIESLSDNIFSKIPKIPGRLNNILDLLILLIMSGAGWFWMASTYALQVSTWAYIKEEVKKYESKKEEI